MSFVSINQVAKCLNTVTVMHLEFTGGAKLNAWLRHLKKYDPKDRGKTLCCKTSLGGILCIFTKGKKRKRTQMTGS